jgi:hypothetical protein
MLVYVLMFVCMLLALAAAAAAWISARQPDKPLLGCVSDAVLWPLFALNTYPFCNVSKGLDVHAYLKRAMRQTGLRDVGEDTSFLDRYALVLDPQHARKHGGRWTPSGAIFADVNLTNTFVRKLQLEHFLKKHPEILHVPCEKPVFIIGLPRTGTTLLHRYRCICGVRTRGERRCVHQVELDAPCLSVPLYLGADIAHSHHRLQRR